MPAAFTEYILPLLTYKQLDYCCVFFETVSAQKYRYYNMVAHSKSKRRNKSRSSRARRSRSRSPRAGKKSRSSRAGLQFPVVRVYRMLKAGKYVDRVSGTSSVYMAAILELLAAEVLLRAGSAANESNTTKIIPRHLKQAIRKDRALKKYLTSVMKGDRDLDQDLPAVPNKKARKNSRRS